MSDLTDPSGKYPTKKLMERRDLEMLQEAKAYADAAVAVGNQGPQGFQGNPGLDPTHSEIVVTVTDEAAEITSGNAKLTFRAPYAGIITAARASLSVASSSGPIQVDINVNGMSIFTVPVTIDQDEKTSLDAATPAEIADGTLVDDDEVTVDIDSGGSGAKGLKLILYVTRA